VDCEETFFLIVRYTSIRINKYIVSIMEWKVHQRDANISFLNWIIEEEVYREKPQGFEVHCDPSGYQWPTISFIESMIIYLPEIFSMVFQVPNFYNWNH